MSVRSRLNSLAKRFKPAGANWEYLAEDRRKDLEDWAARVERARTRRLAGEPRPPSSSFRDLSDQWAGYYDGDEVAPGELTREIDARFADLGPPVLGGFVILAASYRYRELARRGEQAKFADRSLMPTAEELEAIVAEFDAAQPIDGEEPK